MNYSESELKNIKFGNEIRTRHREQYLKKLRKEFLQIDTNSTNHTLGQISISTIETLLQQLPTKQKIQTLNRAIIQERESVSEQLYLSIMQYVEKYFINVQNENLKSSAFLNDLIALFSNSLLFPPFQTLIYQNYDFPRIVEKVLELYDFVEKSSKELILWLLFSLSHAGPATLTGLISKHQMKFAHQFGVLNPYFTHLLCQLSMHAHSLIDPQILHKLLVQIIDEKTTKQFCFNLIEIFEKSFKNNPEIEYVKKLLMWIERNLFNRYFPAMMKSELFTLLEEIVREKNFLNNFELLSSFMGSKMINQLIQRAQFESNFYNKCMCLYILCELIRNAPFMYQEMIVFRHEELIPLLVSALSLMQTDIVFNCLNAITKIILNWREKKEIWVIIKQSKFQNELTNLVNNPCKEISELSIALLEQCFAK